jgi:hypothetical protein
MSLTVEQLISYFVACRQQLADLRKSSTYRPLFVSIFRAEGGGNTLFEVLDPFARAFPNLVHWSTNSFSNGEQFAIAFYTDDASLTENQIAAAVRIVERITDEARRLLASLPKSIQTGRLAIPDFVHSHSVEPYCSNWWRTLFHLAWHFPRPFLTASRERLLTGRFGGRCEETFIQINGAPDQSDLLPGLIYSNLKDDVCVSSETAINVVIDSLNSFSASTRVDGASPNVLTAESRARFRELRLKFAEYSHFPHPMETTIKLMKFTNSFTMPPAMEWADPFRGGSHAKPTLLLSRLNSDQEICEVRGPATNWFCRLAEEAGQMLPAWILDRPILFDQIHKNASGFRGRISTVDPIMTRGPLERWLGFVFTVLKEYEHEAMSVEWMTNAGALAHGLATLKVNPFEASILAIDLVGFGQSVSNEINNHRLAEPLPTPASIESIADQTFRQRATDGYRSASRLRGLMDQWRTWFNELETTGDADCGLEYQIREAVVTCVRSLFSMGAEIPAFQSHSLEEILDRFPGVSHAAIDPPELANPLIRRQIQQVVESDEALDNEACRQQIREVVGKKSDWINDDSLRREIGELLLAGNWTSNQRHTLRFYGEILRTIDWRRDRAYRQRLREAFQGDRYFSDWLGLQGELWNFLKLLETAPSQAFANSHKLEESSTQPGARSTKDRLHVDDIESFEKVRGVDASRVAHFLKNGMLEISEDAVKRAIEAILSVPFHHRDRPDELNDIYTANVIVNQSRRPTAFMLKGPGIGKNEMTIAHCGKNGDQLVRLFESPADLFVIQFVGRIAEMVIKDVEGKIDALHKRGKAAQFLILDGQDTARLLFAYEKLDPNLSRRGTSG